MDLFFHNFGNGSGLIIGINADQCGNIVEFSICDDFGKAEHDGGVLDGKSNKIAHFLLALLELNQKSEVVLALLNRSHLV